jgi:hypothetical protein
MDIWEYSTKCVHRAPTGMLELKEVLASSLVFNAGRVDCNAQYMQHNGSSIHHTFYANNNFFN